MFTNIDLIRLSYPGGLQFCDRSRWDEGDLKKIAFIKFTGQIKYETKKELLPEYIIERIEDYGVECRQKFIDTTRINFKHDRFVTLDRLYDMVTHDIYFKATQINDLLQRLEYLIDVIVNAN